MMWNALKVAQLELAALLRPTQLKPELTVGLFKVGDWVIRKREYRNADWVWGGQPCEVTMVQGDSINLRVYGEMQRDLWCANYFTLASPSDEPVIMPAWEELPAFDAMLAALKKASVALGLHNLDDAALQRSVDKKFEGWELAEAVLAIRAAIALAVPTPRTEGES